MSAGVASAMANPISSRLSKTDRLLIGAGFVLTTVVTSYVGFIAQDRAAECQAIRDQRIAEVERFRTVAGEFEPLVSAYMGDALEGNPSVGSKAAVLLNLRQQRARLAYVSPFLDADGKEAAQKFDEAVVNFIVESNEDPTGAQMGPLYQELNYIFASSQDLIDASNRATGVDGRGPSFWKNLVNCAEV